MTVVKGKQVQTFKPAGQVSAELVEAMLGPTGNLRAPTLVSGKAVLVGYSDDSYAALLD